MSIRGPVVIDVAVWSQTAQIGVLNLRFGTKPQPETAGERTYSAVAIAAQARSHDRRVPVDNCA